MASGDAVTLEASRWQVPDDEVLFYGPRLVLCLADQGEPAPNMELAKDVVFDLPTRELTVGAFCERMAAAEPDRRIAYGASATASSYLYNLDDHGGYQVCYSTSWMYDEHAREGAA